MTARTVFKSLATAAAFWAAVALSAEPSAELIASLDAAAPGEPVAVIVSFRSKTTARTLRKALADDDRATRRRETVSELEAAAESDASSIIATARSMGARDLRVLWVTGAVSMRASPELIDALLADPAVVQIRPDGQLIAPMALAGEALPAQWNINMVRAPELWARGFRGDGAVIASLDTGVDGLHPGLAPSFRGGTNSWYDGFGVFSAPRDNYGHGTLTMGLMVGGDSAGAGIGVAPEARWIAGRVFDQFGFSTESLIHQAFQWILDPDGNPSTDDAPDVVNNSWGITIDGACDTRFQPDIDALRAADISVVFSGGNDGPLGGASPANNGHVISVGAVDIDRSVTYYSGRGPSTCDGAVFPKVVAPGDNVLTTDLSAGGRPLYVLAAGTSFAAPHVAGVIALLRAAVPLATADEVDAAIAATAVDLGAPGPDNDSGRGLIDAVAALEWLQAGVDRDRDGFGARDDCNDDDARMNPRAAEIRGDGIDQDCNGYDLTLKVHYAVYSHDGTSLQVRVTSRRGAAAGLQIVEVGPLTYRAQYNDWILQGAAMAGAARTRLTVRGPEGEVVVTPRPPTRRRTSPQ